MPDFSDVSKQPLPKGDGVNKPASGTYGEKASQARLASALPSAEGAAPAEQPFAPMPGSPVPSPPASVGGRPLNAPAGVPTPLLAPAAPGRPLGTPLAGPATGPTFAQARSRTEATVLYLTQLSESQEVSEETRMWARTVLATLVADGRQ